MLPYCQTGSKDRIRHYTDVNMSLMASQITSLTIVYSHVCSGTDQRKHQSSASLAFVRGIHRGPVNSPHKRPVSRKMFPFDDVIMNPSESIALEKDVHFRLIQEFFNVYLCVYLIFHSSACFVYILYSYRAQRYCSATYVWQQISLMSI